MLSVNSVGGLQLLWKNPIGKYQNAIESSPAVVNGVIYFGSDDGNVYALNASTGAKLWSFSTGSAAALYVSPAVANGVVYIGSFDANMYALNASMGTKLWSYNTGGAVSSSPAVVNGVVYFGSTDSNVYALNAGTGAKLWSYATGTEILDTSPVVANGVVYFGSEESHVYALNAGTGVVLWSSAISMNSSSPAVANGVVYIGSADGNLYALNASTGAKLWSYATHGNIGSSPAVANGVVYISSQVGNLYALNASTGAKLWSYAIGIGGNSSPTIVDGVAYIRDGSQTVGPGNTYAFGLGSADLFLRIKPSTTTVHQGDLLTFAFPVWNLGPGVAEGEVLSSLQVPAGTTFDYVRISGTPGLGTCTHPAYGETGQIVCHEGDGMAPNTTWTVRLTVKVTAPAGTVISANAATMSDTPDPNMDNNTATVSLKVQ